MPNVKVHDVVSIQIRPSGRGAPQGINQPCSFRNICKRSIPLVPKQLQAAPTRNEQVRKSVFVEICRKSPVVIVTYRLQARVRRDSVEFSRCRLSEQSDRVRQDLVLRTEAASPSEKEIQLIVAIVVIDRASATKCL